MGHIPQIDKYDNYPTANLGYGNNKKQTAQEIFREIEETLFSAIALGRDELDLLNTTKESFRLWQTLKQKFGVR